MKTYDVTISITLVDLGSPLDHRDMPTMVHQAAADLVASLGNGKGRAAALQGFEVLDRDTIPQPATICARCISPA